MKSVIEVGAHFDSYVAFKDALEEFSQSNYVQFYIRRSRTLENAAKDKLIDISFVKKSLKYYNIKMCCIYGGAYRKDKRTRNLRKCKTLKQDCPSNVKCCLSKCEQFLVVTEVNMLHNHPVSKELFKRLPQQRSLPPEVREKVASLMKMNVNRKQLRESLALKLGKVVFPKDLKNIANAYNNRSNTQPKTKIKMPLSYDEKFLQISSITEKINDVVSQCSGEDYERNKRLLEDILRIFLASSKSESSVSNHDKPSKSLQIANETAVESCSSKLVASQVESFSSIQISQPIHKTDCLQLLHMPLNKKICGVSDSDGISNTFTKSKGPVFCHNDPSESLQTENRSVVEGCISEQDVSQVDLSSVQVSQPIQKTKSLQLLHTPLNEKICRVSDSDGISNTSTKSKSPVFCHNKPIENLQTEKRSVVEGCRRELAVSHVDLSSLEVSQPMQKTERLQSLHMVDKKISRVSDLDRIFTNSTKSESTVFHHDKPSQNLQTSKKAKVQSCNRKQITSLLESSPNIQASQSVQKTKTLEVIFVGSCRNPANGMKIYLVK